MDRFLSDTFAAHLKNVFQPNPATNVRNIRSKTEDDFPIAEPCEVIKIIKEQLQSPGCDLITPKMLIELPLCAVGTICQLFNAMTRLGCCPKRWKKSIIIMVPKPEKDHTLTSSYRPISLLSFLSKLFEKCLRTRNIPYFRRHNSISAHQFGFREKHGTIEQVNRITSEIRSAFENREYCTAVFLDESQAFDGLTAIKIMLPNNTHKLLKSYLYNRVFAVLCNSSMSDEHNIEAGVPQGSVLGPTLYLLYTSDILTSGQLTMSTFADDTAILSRSKCPQQASAQLAAHLDVVEKWDSDWRIKVNEQKCKQVAFTLNRRNCPNLTQSTFNLSV